jgi:hypothetical protein
MATGFALPSVVRLPTLETKEARVASPVRLNTHAAVCMSSIQPWKYGSRGVWRTFAMVESDVRSPAPGRIVAWMSHVKSKSDASQTTSEVEVLQLML